MLGLVIQALSGVAEISNRMGRATSKPAGLRRKRQLNAHSIEDEFQTRAEHPIRTLLHENKHVPQTHVKQRPTQGDQSYLCYEIRRAEG